MIDYSKNTMSIDSAEREWKEIYLRGNKVGYTVSLIKPFKKGYFIQEEILLRLNLMGMGRNMFTVTQSMVDRDFLLKNFYFKMVSGVVNFILSGKVEGDHLLLESGRGRDRRTQKIKLSRTPMIGAGIGHFFKSRKIRVGESFKIPIFDPSTMAQKEVVVRVVAKEPIKIHGIIYDSFRLEMEMWGRQLTFWLDRRDGSTLKEEGFMGLNTVKSSAANAPLGIEDRDEDDFYEIVAIELDRDLPDPARLGYLKLKMDGIDHAPASHGGRDGTRQKFHEGVIEIRKERPPFKSSYSLPYDRFNDPMVSFLRPELNIESDAKEIMKKAGEIAGDVQNPLSVARKLLKWVYDNIEKKPVVSVPSALEVLRTRVGDCNEHATLLTALLRASGIPARISVGLVYSRNKFLYHAWTEAYVGYWISMDATLNQMPTDVSHIMLMQGNLDKQVEIAGLIGKLKLELLDYRYD